MTGAIIGLLLGILPFFMHMPLIAPVFGMALGANAILKERRAPERNPNQIWVGIAAMGIGAIGVALQFLHF